MADKKTYKSKEVIKKELKNRIISHNFILVEFRVRIEKEQAIIAELEDLLSKYY